MQRDKFLPLQALVIFVLLGLLVSLGLKPYTSEFSFLNIQETLLIVVVISILFSFLTRWLVAYAAIAFTIYILRLVYLVPAIASVTQ